MARIARMTTLALLVFASTAVLVAAELDMKRVLELKAEGKKHFDASADVDLDFKKRNEHRKKAYGLLTEAFEILDGWCDTHPEDIERLEDLIVEIHQMRYWLRKESPTGLLEGDDEKTRRPREKDWPDKPPPDLKDPAQPGPARPRPEPPMPRTPLDDARDFEKRHPLDRPGILEAWLAALEALEDPGSPEYAEALGRVAEISAEMKEAYRRLRNEDPDSIDAKRDPGREAAIAAKLEVGLSSKDATVRAQTADQLAALGYTPAAARILAALKKEKETAVRARMFLALVRLGGRRTCRTLTKFVRERGQELPLGAVRSLGAIGRRGPVQARYAGLSLGDYVARSKNAEVAEAALVALIGLKSDGVPGLALALETSHKDLKLRAISALGATKDPRGAPALCELLPVKADQAEREAAVKALVSIGLPAVPALIDALKNRKTRRYAAVSLYEITGEPHGEDPKAWAEWWREGGR
jgi:HEAT repeat protein